MKRWHRHEPGRGSRKLSRLFLAAVLAACLFSVFADVCSAAQVLLLKQGDSKIMTFSKMKRVWVDQSRSH